MPGKEYDKKCECMNCTRRCPQEELASQIAEGRMYATKEVIRLQKELEDQKKINKEIRDKAIEETLETVTKAICAGCGYLDGYKCTYNGANCGVSKPMLESVTKALTQMKKGFCK